MFLVINPLLEDLLDFVLYPVVSFTIPIVTFNELELNLLEVDEIFKEYIVYYNIDWLCDLISINIESINLLNY